MCSRTSRRQAGGEVFRLVVGQGMMLALIGLLVGLPLALGMGRAVAGMPFGIAPSDFATFASVAMVLAVVALAGCYIPARRALRVDPIIARCDTNNPFDE